MDKIRKTVNKEVSRVLFGDPDHFTETFWLFCYGAVILVFSTTYNINAIIPRESSLYSKEYYERLVVIFHIALILIGIGLIISLLVEPIKEKIKSGSLERRRPKIFPSHVVVVAWILTTISVLFQIWKIVFEAVLFDCDYAVMIPLTESMRHRTLMYAADFIFYIVFSIYLILQCVYIHVWSKYKVPGMAHCGGRLSLATMHIIVVNLAIYVRMTLIEASHTLHHTENYLPEAGPLGDDDVEEKQQQSHEHDPHGHLLDEHGPVPPEPHHRAKRAAGHGCDDHHESHWNCSMSAYSNPRGMAIYKDTVNANIVEPFGFAMCIECILTFAIFIHAIQHHIHDEEHEGHDEHHGESDGGGNLHHLPTPAAHPALQHHRPSATPSTLTKRATFMGQVVRVKHDFDKKEEKDYVMPMQMPFRLKAQAITSMVMCAIVFALSVAFAITFFNYVYWYWRWGKFSDARNANSTTLNEANANRAYGHFEGLVITFLATEITASLCIIIICHFGLWHQIRKRPIPQHALADISLLMYSMNGEIALAFFIFLSCIFDKAETNHDTDEVTIKYYRWDHLRGAFIAKSIIDIVAVIMQSLFVARSFGYKTYTDRRKWLFEATSLASVMFYNLLLWIVEVYARKFTYRANFVAAGHFYDNSVWAIITEVCYPIGIFFRFHCFVLAISIFGMLIRDIKKRKQERKTLIGGGHVNPAFTQPSSGFSNPQHPRPHQTTDLPSPYRGLGTVSYRVPGTGTHGSSTLNGSIVEDTKF